MRLLIVFILLPLAVIANAENTIYRCKNPQGKLVFQQVPCAEDQITGNGTPQVVWRKMRSLVSEGEKILNALGADVASIKRCQANMVDYQAKLDALKPKVLQVAREHPNLKKAHSALESCARCRTSAVSNCSLAKEYLDRAMVKLTEY